MCLNWNLLFIPESDKELRLFLEWTKCSESLFKDKVKVVDACYVDFQDFQKQNRCRFFAVSQLFIPLVISMIPWQQFTYSALTNLHDIPVFTANSEKGGIAC